MFESSVSPVLQTWIDVSEDSDFPIQNIPFGVFLTPDDVVTIGTRIGDTAIDLGAMHRLGYFKGIALADDIFSQDCLNDFISDGKKTWRLVRNRIAKIFDANNASLRDNEEHRAIILFSLDEIEMQLPVRIGDYTNFYSSKDQMSYMENLKKINQYEDFLVSPLSFPLGYHGRSSSIVPSGIPIHRPYGQILPKDASKLELLPSNEVDFELEMAFITTDANVLGESVPVREADEYIFGMVIFNNWSARDIQKWERTQPTSSFLAKNFASSISPWIVTMDALAPFRVRKEKQIPEPLPYLQKEENYTYDIHLEVFLADSTGDTTMVSKTNYLNTFWTMDQQLTHHTISGCKVNSGDLMSSGAISGNTDKSGSSLLEITQGGTKKIILNNGSERTYLKDNDTITIKGYCKKHNLRIGFGEVSNTLLKPWTKHAR
ncbi:fumarylacetoacetase [Capnocytophaga stomatis]|uniref:fumarylacetoacetase n=1 Tax=Capnocytophaga stomatis TaxID=1848904 RepID=A0A250FTX9_9FLAO|nr:fumarylacetoacetase [Capnocytophaga stomatis]ATA88524.1 fumarylacetoacetase [Capnocytophaga stomatis]GIJ96056.1 fumarylacetoacetase [Capnocytophaga stomatis]